MQVAVDLSHEPHLPKVSDVGVRVGQVETFQPQLSHTTQYMVKILHHLQASPPPDFNIGGLGFSNVAGTDVKKNRPWMRNRQY